MELIEDNHMVKNIFGWTYSVQTSG